MGKHRVKQHHWERGILKTFEHFFNTLEEAVAYANSSDAHVIKIYDETGQLVQHITPAVETNTYA